MLRRLFTVFLLMLLVGAGLAVLISHEPGYVLVSYGLWTLETSVWLFFLLVLVIFGLSYLLLRSFLRLRSTRGVLSDWFSNRAYSRMLANCQIQLDAGEYQEVIDTLETLDRLHDQELRLLARARAGLEDWPGLLQLLPRLRKQKVFGPQMLDALASRAYLGQLRGAGDDDFKAAWAGIPSDQRKHVSVLECYARRLLDAGEEKEAEKLLSRALKSDWDARLVTLYGRIQALDPARRLKTAESWLKQHPEDPNLLLCLGRLSLNLELWGQARDFFEASHQAAPSAEACAEIARLLFNLGERELSAQYYREGLLLRENDLPELPQPGPGQLRNLQAG